ncbi:MAG: hybrid sensor histidine kinase/response regulator, partial [Gammaproteobacteria bacterium]|nr:hybrid sensor histidine kinase/response regulator [Gammaproteobacteria bacterium]
MLFTAFGAQNLATDFLILFLFPTINVIAALVLSSYFAAYVAFCSPLTLIVAARLLVESDPIFFTLGWFVPAALPMHLFYAYHISKTWQQSIQLRFENLELVSELTKQKNEAEAAQNIAEEANRSKTRFLAAASHDLRQPLHALTLFAEALAHGTHDVKQRGIVDNIKTSVTAMEGLFNTLLDISKLDAGVIQPKPRGVRMRDILAPLENECKELARQNNLNFSCDHRDTIVQTDPVLLETVLRNLLSNAFRYTQRGGIWIRCFPVDDNIIAIEVEDTGIGIPNDQCDYIFNEFSQLNNTERNKTKGLGLGLAIVKRIVTLLQHSIHVESKLYLGSKFILHLPKADVASAIEDSDDQLGIETYSTPSLCVLIVDDDDMARNSLSELLIHWGYHVISAESAREATDSIARGVATPDVIIADYQLRNNLTGIDAIDCLHAMLERKIPALIVTGYILPEHLQQAKQRGFPILNKPVMPAKIRAFLSHCERQLDPLI